MKIKDIPVEELELMSYTDLTYMLLKEKKKPMNTANLFKEICKLLDYSDDEYTAKIGDYYTSLNIDKRFILLESNEWDISDNHSVELVIDDDEEETDENLEEEEVEEEFDNEIEDFDSNDELEDDDISDLSIVDDDDDELEDE